MSELNQQYKITFDEGLFGFENNKEFIPVAFDENSDAMIALHSVETQGLSFVIMNPFMLKEDYNPCVPESELKSLGENSDNKYSWYVICVVKNPVGESTVNLKCPIVVNPYTRKAKQVILSDSRYSLRHTLNQLTQKEKE